MVPDHDNHTELAALGSAVVADNSVEDSQPAEADNLDDGPVQRPELKGFHEHHTALVVILPP